MLQKKWLIILAILILIAGISDFFVLRKRALEQPQLVEEQSGLYPAKGGTAEQRKVYTQTVSSFEGERIQFDERCQAIPSQLTFKNGAKVMFDNRSGDARQISIGGVGYQFPGYGYKIITLASSRLPKTLWINCGSAVNVGQILLQK